MTEKDGLVARRGHWRSGGGSGGGGGPEWTATHWRSRSGGGSGGGGGGPEWTATHWRSRSGGGRGGGGGELEWTARDRKQQSGEEHVTGFLRLGEKLLSRWINHCRIRYFFLVLVTADLSKICNKMSKSKCDF
jgi:hypothetical protein